MNLSTDLVYIPACDLVPVETQMSAEQLRTLLEQLGRADPERGHALVDDLMRATLRAIRNGHPSPRELATAVLVAACADFSRWCA